MPYLPTPCLVRTSSDGRIGNCLIHLVEVLESDLKKFFPYASKSTIRRNTKADSNRPAGLCSDDAKPTKGGSLERRVQGKEKGSLRPEERTRIRFLIYSVRPADWDNYSTKQLQDCLVKSGLLDGDDWDQLLGDVIPQKVHTKAEERTVIQIWKP